jgi:pSer/pThr/pTyr-binding forkhead associated (FHA) protein
VGSSNGTCLNASRLAVLKRYPLKDGDVIAMCNLNVEFFIANDLQTETHDFKHDFSPVAVENLE